MAQIADTYAQTLYELSVPEVIVAEAGTLLLEVPQVQTVLASPVTALRSKKALIDRIFPEEIRSFIKVVCEKQRAEQLPEIFAAYESYVKKQHQVLDATLYYVTMPTKEQKVRMETFLCRKYDMSEANLTLIEDRSLIGGFILEACNREFDFSLRGRFRQLEQNLIRR